MSDRCRDQSRVAGTAPALIGGQGLGFALAGAVAEVLGPHRAGGLLALIGLAGVALLAPTSSRTANE